MEIWLLNVLIKSQGIKETFLCYPSSDHIRMTKTDQDKRVKHRNRTVTLELTHHMSLSAGRHMGTSNWLQHPCYLREYSASPCTNVMVPKDISKGSMLLLLTWPGREWKIIINVEWKEKYCEFRDKLCNIFYLLADWL